MGDQDMKTALHSWMADAQLRVIQDYVSRGRHLERTPEETLAKDWVELMRAWAAVPEKGQDPRRRDIGYEYSLRGLQPPCELVQAEMDALALEQPRSFSRWMRLLGKRSTASSSTGTHMRRTKQIRVDQLRLPVGTQRWELDWPPSNVSPMLVLGSDPDLALRIAP